LYSGYSSSGYDGKPQSGKPQFNESKARIPERLLARLWQKRAARREGFRTRNGARVRVVYPGRASTGAGPDFRDALLEVEDVGLVQGDVEIHVKQRDWDSHGHGKDPNYNGVVLHVALEVDSPATQLQSGREAPVVSLAPLLEEDQDSECSTGQQLWSILERRGYRQSGSIAEAAALLDRAGDDRFLARAAYFQKVLLEQDPEQTLYEALMEGLGYSSNQQPFLKLAAKAPFPVIRKAVATIAKEDRAEVLASWLLNLSGLALPVPESNESPAVSKSHRPPSRAGFGSPMETREWHCFRLRPSNHPRRRILGAAGLLHRYLDTGLVQGLQQAAAKGTPGPLLSALAVGAGSGTGPAPIGRGRAADLAVNVMLPFLEASTSSSPNTTEADYLELYHRFGKLQDNELIREMGQHLLAHVCPGPAWSGVLTTARRQQGLLHLRALLAGAG
jgi:hypothetical protein